MTQPTPKQIELSKQIWEAGVRVEIQEGMWCLDTKSDLLVIICKVHDENRITVAYKEYVAEISNKHLIPILDFETAVEWLRKKGWKLIKGFETDYHESSYVLWFRNENEEMVYSSTEYLDGKTISLNEAGCQCVLEVARRKQCKR